MIYTKGLWTVWTHLHQLLHFNICEAFLPAHWTTNDALSILPINKQLSHDHRLTLASKFANLGIKSTEDLWNRNMGK